MINDQDLELQIVPIEEKKEDNKIDITFYNEILPKLDLILAKIKARKQAKLKITGS